ncbi:hypothetical protein ACFL5D_04030 [Candidatus Neomarinimicrobiota bacterium]
MKKNHLISIIVIITSIVLFFSCTENPIPYDLSDSNLNLDTVIVRSIEGGTYFAPPLMGSTEGLYFGDANGFGNLFSLIQFSSLSKSGAIWTYSLLDTTVTIDSLVITFTATDDSLLTNSEFELYYFPEGGDSVFSETESNYLNITEADMLNAVPIGRTIFAQDVPDSTESIYPKLSFLIENKDDILNFIADTTDIENRTFMLKNVDPIDSIVSINSRESLNYPIINVHYRVGLDTLHSVFFPMKDITIVEPRQITEDDINSISVGRAAGLKSIIKFDFSDIPIDSTTLVIKSAELIFHSISNISFDNYEIKAAILEDSVEISNYWEIDGDLYTIEQDILMTGIFEDNQLKIEIRPFLQGVNTGSYSNFGLKLYGGVSSDPFQSANLIFDPNNSDNNPILKIVYVKL